MEDTYTIQGYTFPIYIEHQEMIEYVQRGIALLDKQCPGWESKIDLVNLSLSEGCNCILGQIYDEYNNGVQALFGCDAYAREPYAMTDSEYQTIIEHGFLTEDDYDELEIVWVTLLQQESTGNEADSTASEGGCKHGTGGSNV